MTTDRVTRLRAYESVASRLEAAIADETYRVGEQLPSERVIADDFGVSRVVVREAMRHLESRGLVDVRHGSGAFVRDRKATTVSQGLTLLLELETSSLVDLYFVRQALELLAARMAAINGTPADWDAVEVHLTDMHDLVHQVEIAKADYAKYNELDEAFHLGIAEASANHPLITLMHAILPHFRSGRHEILERTESMERFMAPDHLQRVHEEHRNIHVALTNGDSGAAEHFMYQHLQRSIAIWTRHPSALSEVR